MSTQKNEQLMFLNVIYKLNNSFWFTKYFSSDTCDLVLLWNMYSLSLIDWWKGSLRWSFWGAALLTSCQYFTSHNWYSFIQHSQNYRVWCFRCAYPGNVCFVNIFNPDCLCLTVKCTTVISQLSVVHQEDKL